MSERDNPPGQGEYKLVQGLMRGLSLLHCLNRCDGGARITELAQKTGLHRTTVRRLLETLQHEGYVRRSESDDSYLLTLKVRELSEGFRDEQWVSQFAAPLLGQLLQEVVWPTDISTLDVDAMVIRETTHRFSRLSFHRSMVGRRLPMLLTAAGRAYIANCPEQERNQILQLLASREDSQGRLARDTEYVDKLIRKTRQDGYGSNYRDWGEEGRIAAIALPIRHEDRVLGCLNLVYIADAMTIEEAAKRYLKSMQSIVNRIERSLSPQIR
ncbi:DNA-binding transcriptional regulator [Marinobacterium sediminicola]|uniref:Transcriptional regulator, IclR family n=1 Tax=Marinobacterium sediminicola TaxID=518898 RepID=A0ABY1S4M0_9GAMM|nr:DNA-binding transcriptional regulator [Marinobacterium sediminicola]ULG68438.1 DNA-binding transcriptional regulator [Marinobacterium sediminicola]SMR78483.1 transcriptional regulator, IclR family [Marinobacterium sediminicola]